MLVFLSWSGPRSKAVAQAFESWLVPVIQAVDPWISSDIDKGARWSPEIAQKLEQSRVGIICLTRDNLKAPWILFEAGALSKTKDAYVCTFLLDLAAADVEQPLGQFQHTNRDKEDVRRLVGTINRAVQNAGERSLPESTLDKVFETNWPSLSETLDQIAAQPPEDKPQERSEKEMLQEVLESIRAQGRRLINLELTFRRRPTFLINKPGAAKLADLARHPVRQVSRVEKTMSLGEPSEGQLITASEILAAVKTENRLQDALDSEDDPK